MIDWPNLLVGAVIGFIVAYVLYLAAKQNADRKYKHLVGILEGLEQAKAAKVDRDGKGNIISAEPIVLTAEPGKLSLTGQVVNSRVDGPDDGATT